MDSKPKFHEKKYRPPREAPMLGLLSSLVSMVGIVLGVAVAQTISRPMGEGLTIGAILAGLIGVTYSVYHIAIPFSRYVLDIREYRKENN